MRQTRFNSRQVLAQSWFRPGLDLVKTWLSPRPGSDLRGSGWDTDVFWITHGRILDHKSETQRESEFTFDAGTDFQHEPLRGTTHQEELSLDRPGRFGQLFSDYCFCFCPRLSPRQFNHNVQNSNAGRTGTKGKKDDGVQDALILLQPQTFRETTDQLVAVVQSDELCPCPS
ncbi:hypothetical protein WMY93_015385 [Mugilogobius chulae]|uniref:Uncharacterized protein n=1 Tax=Mugilogobius chulae TaxID=88201 RepID=A0AAW0P246_9GOBI